MTLLTICQGALEEIGEMEVPTSIMGSSNLTATQIRALANREGYMLSRRHPWQTLVKEKTFTTTAAAVQTGAIPTDFSRIISATWWDRANYWRLLGPANPQQWQAINSGIVSTSLRKWFRIRGDDMLLWPTPSNTTDTIAFEYVSTYWVDTDADGDGEAAAWAADTNTAVLDEDLMRMGLIWRWLMAKGLPYAEQLAMYEREVDKAIARDGGSPILNAGGSLPINTFGANVPDTGFGS